MMLHCVQHNLSVQWQKGLTASHLYIQLAPFVSELTNYSTTDSLEVVSPRQQGDTVIT